jgi:cyclic pyranopterin phosphate synthase
MKEFSHIDENGKANMVNVMNKPIEKRTAIAEGFIRLNPDTISKIKINEMKKGDVLTVAQIAGIQASKQTSSLIPLCHNLFISNVKIDSELLEDKVKVTCSVSCHGQTGVEMEALTGVSVALLTIYDMCKAIDKDMTISDIKLINKMKESI